VNDLATLLIQCPDRPGIVAALSSFLYRHGANITDLDQHSATEVPTTYFMRLEFQTQALVVPLDQLRRLFADQVARSFEMEWRMTPAVERKKLAILVSKHDHAMMEVLWQWRRGDLRADVTAVVSNHPDLADQAAAFGVPFHHVPNDRARRAEAEREMLAILDGRADVVALARYMQIVSPDFAARFANRLINIHHSFLPAFAGADPYGQAYERGVKIVGATAHYVTAELDAGPIIEQDVARVTHRHAVEDLRAIGRDLERRVFARAVKWHCEDRVLVHGNKTIVFAS
jgi:formyltetrahydrofolate deformylase